MYLRTLALEAGAIMKENFNPAMEKEWKEDETPLTVTDVQINRLVLKRVENDFPDVHFVGEEGSREVPNAKYAVYLDPVDGTIPFAAGIPVAAFCVAVIDLETGLPVSAVIYDPFQERIWTADKDEGTYFWTKKWNPPHPGYNPPYTGCRAGYHSWECKATHVSSHQTVKRSGICMVWWKDSSYDLHDVADSLMHEGAKWTNPCSIAYFGGIVASGGLEATISPGDRAWETAAMALIVEEAGGKATDIYGRPLRFGLDCRMNGHIISNGFIHDELVELVRRQQPQP